jgi:glycosyltransferase involved in cell wall biosynthesis
MSVLVTGGGGFIGSYLAARLVADGHTVRRQRQGLQHRLPSDGVTTPSRPIRVVRIIARLNIGGPAVQAITLTERLRLRGYETLLIRGTEGPHEGSMDHLAQELGVRPLRIARMGREVGLGDLIAFIRLVRELRRFQPDIVHTHAAKAGTLGRLAALVPGRGRPRVTVHTFHGHSLSGYFSPGRAAVFTCIERFLAKHTTRLIAVSEEVRDDLVRLGVAPRASFEVVRLGLDLTRFDVGEEERAERAARLRATLGIPAEARVVTLMARLVPVKRVDRFLAVAQHLAGELDDVWFLIAGDGELREHLRTLAHPEQLVWAGFQRDVAAVCFASDVVVLTSDNEGTPVSLIEAQAAGVPVVSTCVGGAASVIEHRSGALVEDREDIAAFAAAVRAVLDHPERAGDARAHIVQTFSLDRLAADIDSLYRQLLANAAPAPGFTRARDS